MYHIIINSWKVVYELSTLQMVKYGLNFYILNKRNDVIVEIYYTGQ